LLTYCVPVLPTFDVSKCVSTVESLTCQDITEVIDVARAAGKLAPTNAALCADFADGLQKLREATAALKASTGGNQVDTRLKSWLEGVVLPCAASGCASTPHPFTADEVMETVREFSRAVVLRTLKPWERFAWEWRWALFAVAVGVVLAAFAALWRTIHLKNGTISRLVMVSAAHPASALYAQPQATAGWTPAASVAQQRRALVTS
jgi:hypothetical protein